MTGAEEPSLPSRREIYQAVRDAPGTHFSALADRLEYASGTLQYHLAWLVEEGLLERADDGEYTRYYPTGEFDDADRAAMAALRRKYSRRIIAHLAADGPATTSELAERLEKAPSTVSWHLSRLEEAGIVDRERDGRAVEYALVDRDRIVRLYVAYRGSFTDRLVDGLLGIWDGY
ncbi:MAG: winged helix-turn-helix transcriptional regulator [Haloarculaceae archaeon]